MAVPGVLFPAMELPVQEGCWETSLAQGYQDGRGLRGEAKGGGLVGDREAQADLIAANTCLERSYRGNGAKLCSVEMARTRRGNRHVLCLGSFKLAIREKNVTRRLVAPRGGRVSTHGGF